MTAIVGILNKQAIAIAADSAVTITGPNGTKIYNYADKIFTLSKHHPVGVMLYNAASFMGTPWEIIIKLYRKKLKDGYFDSLKDYVDDFLVFLREKKFFASKEGQELALYDFMRQVIEVLITDSLIEHPDLQQSPFSNDNKRQCAELLSNWINDIIPAWESRDLFCPDFQEYSFDTFRQDTWSHYDKLLTHLSLNEAFELELKGKLFRLIYLMVCKQEQFTGFTGLVFVGYGEEEIYPSLIAVNISLAIKDRLRFHFSKESVIDNDNYGEIVPFAQADVMQTILSGIAPDLFDAMQNNFQKVILGYNQELINMLGVEHPLAKQIANVDINNIIKPLLQEFQKAQETNHINPLLDAVNMLSKQDLAEMAESLIYLTYLKRRITFAQESVGGPVDVAIISKGDGFIWIKRKHYFKPELNQQFNTQYFNH